MSEQKEEMRLADMTLAAFMEALASASAAPGGGAATALTGALGASLAAMVARLTLGRPRYAAAETIMAHVCTQADALRARLLSLADADDEAYTALMETYQLPKDTAEQRDARAAAVQMAMRGATATPLATVEACAEVLALAAQAAEHGNRNAAGDAIVAAMMAHAGLTGAASNVRVNLLGVEDEVYREEATARVAHLLSTGEQALAATLRAANERL